jgi:hypothetical protein
LNFVCTWVSTEIVNSCTCTHICGVAECMDHGLVGTLALLPPYAA